MSSSVDESPAQPTCCSFCHRHTPKKQACSRCKLTFYCSIECLKADWQEHKKGCFTINMPGCICQVCKKTSKIFANCNCCGYLFCQPCFDTYAEWDTNQMLTSFKSCPSCEKPGEESLFPSMENIALLKNVIAERQEDPRRPQWILILASRYKGDEQVALLEEAASLGSGEAYCALGGNALEEQQWAEARNYFNKGAKLYHTGSIFILAFECQHGYFPLDGDDADLPHREPDINKAVYWLKLGVELGDEQCMYELGKMYQDGTRGKKNLTKAHILFSRASRTSHVDSMRALGSMYATGEGVQRDEAEARRWWNQCIRLGDDQVLPLLGLLRR